MVRIFGGSGGGTTTVITAPAPENTEVRYQSVDAFDDMDPDDATPGALRLLTTDGRLYRMSIGAEDASKDESWEIADSTRSRSYATEEARIARTGWTPREGETIKINGTVKFYTAGATATADELINVSSALGPDISGGVTRSSDRPQPNKAGTIHFREVAGGEPVRWDYSAKNSWRNTGSGTVTLTPTGAKALMVVCTFSGTSSTAQWFDSEEDLIAESAMYTQAQTVTTPITLYVQNAAALVSLKISGVSNFSEDLNDFSELVTLDFEDSGLTGNCPYLGTLAKLRTLNIKGNPGLTMHESCTKDSPNLTVVSA